jgi:hypothetical protein
MAAKYKNPPIWAKFGFHVDYDASYSEHFNFFTFFCGNGGHSEISKPQDYVYTCQTKFLANFIGRF